jgi:hypothetical protein
MEPNKFAQETIFGSKEDEVNEKHCLLHGEKLRDLLRSLQIVMAVKRRRLPWNGNLGGGGGGRSKGLHICFPWPTNRRPLTVDTQLPEQLSHIRFVVGSLAVKCGASL